MPHYTLTSTADMDSNNVNSSVCTIGAKFVISAAAFLHKSVTSVHTCDEVVSDCLLSILGVFLLLEMVAPSKAKA